MRPPATPASFRPIVLLGAIMVMVGCGEAPRADVAEMFVSVASEDGFDVQTDCVEGVLGAMSDDDVNKLNDAGLDGAADLSEQGVGVLTDIRNQCIDVDQFVDSVVADLQANPVTQDVDIECVRDGLSGSTSVDDVDRALEKLLVLCGPADV